MRGWVYCFLMEQIRSFFVILQMGISLMMVSVPSFSADFQKGLDAYDRGDYQAAIREWRSLAEQGDADAQYRLGLMYRRGLGVAQSDTEAVKWYRLSAEQGNSFGQGYLGVMYKCGCGVPQSDTEAVKWIRLSAKQGNKIGQRHLGDFYRDGGGVPQSDTEAVKWYRLSAAQGSGFAQYNLGVMYEEGRGVAQSNTEAIKWFQLSAEQGIGFAQDKLNQMGIDWTQTQITKAEPKSVEPTKQSKMEGYTGGSILRIIHASSYQGDGIVEGIVDVKEVSEILVNGKTTPFDNLGKFLGFIKTPPNNLEIKALLHDGGSYSLMYEVTVLPEDINDAEEQPETIDFGWLDSLIERDRAIKESEEKENLELKRRREFRERQTTELCKSLNQNHQFSKSALIELSRKLNTKRSDIRTVAFDVGYDKSTLIGLFYLGCVGEFSYPGGTAFCFIDPANVSGGIIEEIGRCE